MEWIPNQPVIFDEETECNSCDVFTFKQLVDNTDETQVQFNIDPCISAEQLITNPNFDDTTGWILGENWSVENNQLCATGETTTQGTRTTYQFDPTKYYKITIIVDSISVGGSFNILLGATLLGTISSTGTYDFYGFPTSFFGNYSLIFGLATPGSEICISNATAYEILTEIIVAVYDEDDNYITQINYTDFADNFTFAKNTVTITIDWGELLISNNCYYLGLLDPCENTNGQNYPAVIDNCTFITNPSYGWTYGGAAWTENATSISGIYIANPLINSLLTQEDVFGSFTTTYSITVVVSAMTGTLAVYFGTNQVGTITTDGTHTITGIPAGTFDLTFKFINAPGGGTIDSACPVEIAPADYTINQRSNTFKLADYTGLCTKVINACNNEDGLGFVFDGSGFSPRIRLSAKLVQAKYSNERTIFEDSAGVKKNIYYSRRKGKQLVTGLLPEYVHDFLSLLLGIDNFYIDGELYSVDDDEYTPDYNTASDNVASVSLLVSKKTQKVININCSDTENVCNLGASYLLQGNLAFRIVQTDGSGILINS